MIIAGYRRLAGQLSRAPGAALLIARLVLGWLMLLHGLKKFQPPGGVAGFQHLLASLPSVPFPAFTGAVLPWLEVAGGVLLMVGALARLAAFVLAAEMAIIAVLIKFGDAHAGVIAPAGAHTPGAEVEFLFIAGLMVVFLLGPGRVSVDAVARLETRAQPPAGRRGSRPEPADQPAG
jgi:putative oxidoreductase